MTRAVMAMPSSPNRSPTVPDNPIARFSWKGPPMTTNSANTANTAIAKEAVETNGAQSQQTDPPTLQLDNVSYAYTKGGKRVLKNIKPRFPSRQSACHHRTVRSRQNHAAITDLGTGESHGRDGAGRRHRPVGTRPIPFSQP